MSKPLSHLFQHRLRSKKGDSHQRAADLAPLEELESQRQAEESGGAGPRGAIIVGNLDLPLAKDLVDAKTGGRFLGMEPVVLFIIGFMLAFILFIAWQISRMPG